VNAAAVVSNQGGGGALGGKALQPTANAGGTIAGVFTAGEVSSRTTPTCSAGASHLGTTSGTNEYLLYGALVTNATAGLLGIYKNAHRFKAESRHGGDTVARQQLVATSDTGLAVHYSMSAASMASPALYRNGVALGEAPVTYAFSGTVETQLGSIKSGVGRSTTAQWAYWFCRVALTAPQQAALYALIAAADVTGARNFLLAIDATTSGLWWPTEDTIIGDGVIDLCGNYSNMLLSRTVTLVDIP